MEPEDVAKLAAIMHHNEFTPGQEIPVTPSGARLVWFNYTLQNWKALVFVIGGRKAEQRYYEVTYKSEKDQVFVDEYTKVRNMAYDLRMIHRRTV